MSGLKDFGKEERAGCFTSIVFMMSCNCLCSVAVPRDAGLQCVGAKHAVMPRIQIKSAYKINLYSCVYPVFKDHTG